MSDTAIPPRPPLVLIASGQEWAVRSLDSVLGPSGYAVLRAFTAQQALELVKNVRPDAIFIDRHMPDQDGLVLCRQLREHLEAGRSTPIIVTTPVSGTREEVLEAYRAGAWLYCTQPIDVEIMLLQLGTLVGAKQEYEQLREQGLVDPRTGLYSLPGLLRRTREMAAEAERKRESLACIAFAFETPEAGRSEDADRDLVDAFSRVCHGAGRASDAFGRIGSADFGVITRATSRQGVERLIQRLGARLNVEVPLGGARLHTEYRVVDNLAESAADAVELLTSATLAARRAARRNSGEGWLSIPS
jgi:PleD family two-component response regulator